MTRPVGLLGAVCLLAALSLFVACGGDTAGSAPPPAQSSSASSSAGGGAAVQQGDYQTGVLTEGLYTSDYFGLRYRVPEGMTATDSQRLKEMLPDQGGDQPATIMGELLVVDAARGSNLLLITEQLEMPMEPATYAEISQRSQTDATWLDGGKLTPVTVGGLEFYRMSCHIQMAEMLLQSDSYLYAKDDRMLVLGISYPAKGESGAEATRLMLEGFVQ